MTEIMADKKDDAAELNTDAIVGLDKNLANVISLKVTSIMTMAGIQAVREHLLAEWVPKEFVDPALGFLEKFIEEADDPLRVLYRTRYWPTLGCFTIYVGENIEANTGAEDDQILLRIESVNGQEEVMAYGNKLVASEAAN